MVGGEWYDWGMSNSNQDAELFEKSHQLKASVTGDNRGSGVTRQWRVWGTGDSTQSFPKRIIVISLITR